MKIDITPDTKIPRLSPDLKLVKGGVDEEGKPFWRLYHPVSHQYFQIGWVEFEYLSRFSLCTKFSDLEKAIAEQTTLEPDEEIFEALLVFLNQHGLVQDTEGLTPVKEEKAVLSELVHKYLFFSIPLVKPQRFLEQTYPYVAFLFTKEITFIAILSLILGSLITLGRVDEFLNTFLDMFSAEGALIIAVTFTIIKVFHELGHAYTAYKYGLNVPHMGIAFMVMYPVFYTETTSAWHLASKKEKVDIGLSGIRIELILASIFLFVWNYSAPGLLQSIAFSVVTISLIGSLLINLNPLMRFDGYFIMGDALGVENLHSRSFACARWWLRKTLFGWQDDCPEHSAASKIRFFVMFGWATLIYRFFLFLGIAILVYVIFPKPFGLILMVIELLWFIVKPISSEIKVWVGRWSELIKYRRGKVTASATLVAVICLFLPIQGYVYAPAVHHIEEARDIYSPYPAQITQFDVEENRLVKQGDILMVMQSPELEKDYKLAENMLAELEKIKRRQQTDVQLMRANKDRLNSQIEELKIKLEAYRNKREQLVIKAPFDGYIKDTNLGLHQGRYVSQEQLLFRIINPNSQLVTAYVTDHDLERLQKHNAGYFRPGYSLSSSVPVKVIEIDQTNISSLDKEELSSIYGGPIYSEPFQSGYDAMRIVPRQSLYKVLLEPDDVGLSVAVPGYVYVAGEHKMPISLFLLWVYSLILPESDVI